MSGDKQKPDKIAELIYRTSLTKDFEKDINQIRKYFEIPPNGFQNKNHFRKWHSKRDGFSFFLSLVQISKKYKLPPAIYTIDLLETRVLKNSWEGVTIEKSNAACLLLPANDDEVKNYGRPFAKLLIFDESSEKEAKDFLGKNWRRIKAVIRFYEGKKRRIRVSKNQKRDEIIYELYRKSRSELGLSRGEYKDIAISEIMKRKYGIRVTPENVRNIIARQNILRSRNN